MGKNLIQQARGKGGPVYRALGFRFAGSASITSEGPAKVIDLVRSRGHSAPLAHLAFDDDTYGFMIAPEGLCVGSRIVVGGEAEPVKGNTLDLDKIPEGTMVYNIESRPGDGGKFVRGSGLAARVVTKTKNKIVVELPSKARKSFHPSCRATIGVVAGGGRTDKPFLKAGNKFHKMKQKHKYWPIVSGGAMNAVDHPFGNKRSSRKSKAKPVPQGAPPGRKVGSLYAKRTGRKRGKQ